MKLSKLQYRIIIYSTLAFLLAISVVIYKEFFWQSTLYIKNDQNGFDPVNFWRFIWDNAALSVITALWTTILIGWFINWFTSTESEAVHEKSLAKVFTDTKGQIFQSLNPAARLKILQNLIHAVLPPGYSAEVASEIDLPVYKSKFNYVINCVDPPATFPEFSKTDPDLVARLCSKQTYPFWIKQNLSYCHHAQGRQESATGTEGVKISLAFHSAASGSRGDGYAPIFRELISLEPRDQNDLLTMRPEALLRFLTEVFQLKVSLMRPGDPRELALFAARLSDSRDSIELCINNPRLINGDYNVQIEICYPCHLDHQIFYVTAPVPLEKNARIVFNHNDRLSDLKCIFFEPQMGGRLFEGNPPEQFTPAPKSIALTASKWMKPSNGVVFVWSNVEIEKSATA